MNTKLPGPPETVVIASHAWIDDQVGGAYRVASEFAEHLAARGQRVCYVCGAEQILVENPAVVRGVEVWRYAYPRRASPHPQNLLGHILGSYRLTRRIAKQARIIGLNGHSPLQFLGASLAVSGSCGRQIYSVHSPFDDELRANWTGRSIGIKRRVSLQVARTIERENCRRADCVHTLSEFTMNSLRLKYRKSVQHKELVCPGWVDTARFRPAVNRQAVRTQLGGIWNSDVPVFFTLRRLEVRMGIDRLIDAAACLINARPDLPFRVIIGGGGALHDDLAQQIERLGLQHHVFLSGRISDDEREKCFAAADCFVLPTTELECFGLIVLEAFACGTPVIATPVAAIPELINGQQRPWLTAGTTAGDLAKRMREFLEGRLACDSNRLRQLAESFEIDKSASRLIDACTSGFRVTT